MSVATRLHHSIPALLVLAFVVTACGGSSNTSGTIATEPPPPPPTEAHARGDMLASAMVGRAGATFDLGSGVRLVIPPGAITTDTQVAVQSVRSSDAFSNREDERAFGNTMVISPEIETENGEPFVLSIPLQNVDGFERPEFALGYEEPTGEAAAGGVASTTRWNVFPAAVNGNRIEARVPRFFGLRVQFVVSR